jgi:hypothetical protein
VNQVGRVVRTVGLAVVTFLLVAIVVGWLRHRDVERSRTHGSEIGVLDAANSRRGTEVVVRGYVFVDSHVGTLLCSRRKTGARPVCDGDVVTLEGLDTSRLAMHRAEVKAGGYDAWSDRDVVLLGSNEGGGTLLVKDVLPG